METCARCGKSIHREELASAVFTTDRARIFYHKDCEEGTEHFTRWKEEASWTYKPTRLTEKEWQECGSRKHLGVWQSIFVERPEEDVWCPDCGLKIAKHGELACTTCSGPAIVVGTEQTHMVFTHGEPLFKLQLRCTENGHETTSYAIISGYTPVAVTPKKKGVQLENRSAAITLKYEPKGDPKKGLTV
ncbi:hypothetical protein E6H36_07885 [Candidatus Bathyarchaeota archaeon]|nr:MAG: hypothetical protein E6H36_07885 [Candidatus Bathyarchaeota archaeon]TMI31058.1 MAG: hypothetical protein E6H29_06550 [Candidatus Bathyarchaeota archaeon]